MLYCVSCQRHERVGRASPHPALPAQSEPAVIPPSASVTSGVDLLDGLGQTSKGAPLQTLEAVTEQHPQAPSTPDEAGIEMGRILAAGSAWGIPIMFAVTMVICLMDRLSWSGSLGIAAWGALIGGPFFGVMVFFGQRVGDLGH